MQCCRGRYDLVCLRPSLLSAHAGVAADRIKAQRAGRGVNGQQGSSCCGNRTAASRATQWVKASGVPVRRWAGVVVKRSVAVRGVSGARTLRAAGLAVRGRGLPIMALSHRRPGGDGHCRVAVASLRRVGACIRRLDRDIRTRPLQTGDDPAGSRRRSSDLATLVSSHRSPSWRAHYSARRAVAAAARAAQPAGSSAPATAITRPARASSASSGPV